MECEVNLLKRKVQEYQEHTKNLRDFSRGQRDKLRQVIMACASQLQEKEAAMEQIRLEHDATLAYIARQLAFLQANMLKEQQKLEAVVGEKTNALEALALENERLRKQNKKLVSKHLSDTTASSGGDSSAKSSFSSKSSEPPRLPPPDSSATSDVVANNDNNDRAALMPVEPLSVEELKPCPPKKQPQTPGPKPPVPSRAGINRLLLQTASLAVTPTVVTTATPAAAAAPPPPRRSTSLGLNNSNLERVDSGRESDLTTSDVEHTTNGGNIVGGSGLGKPRQTNSHDEGFCSSHEDSSGSAGGRCSRTSINHRTVQKPKDIKLRSKAKMQAAAANAASAAAPGGSNPLQTLLEHQVVDDTSNSPGGGGGVTTVTYWTGSFL